MQVKIVKMRPLLKSAYYISLLCWIFVIVESSDDPECTVHKAGKAFNATIVTIPPVSSPDGIVQLTIKEDEEDTVITLKFDQTTEEWFYLDWTHKGISTAYNSNSENKIVEITEGQASGNCKSGKFTWKITKENDKVDLYNTNQRQIFRIKILEAAHVSFYDGTATYNMCLDYALDKSIHNNGNEKCAETGDDTEKRLLEVGTEYTLILEARLADQYVPNMTVVDKTTLSFTKSPLKYKITFEPISGSSVGNEDIIGYITEEAKSQRSRHTTALTPGSTTDVSCTSENPTKSKAVCSDTSHTESNVTSIILGVLTAVLFIALLLTCYYFKYRQMGDKLHPMPESHTNGNAGDAVKGNNDYNAMEEMRENSATDKTQFNRISQMPPTMEEENDIYDSAANVLDRQI